MTVRWCYKTVHFELKKDGLLGSAFLDDAEIEETLNEFGNAGWELVSMVDTRDGVLAVFKQPMEGVQRPAGIEDAKDENGEEALYVAPVIPPVVEESYETMDTVEDEELREDTPGLEEQTDLESRAWLEEPVEEEFVELDLVESDEEYEPEDSAEYEEDEDPGVGSIRIE